MGNSGLDKVPILTRYVADHPEYKCVQAQDEINVFERSMPAAK